MNILNFKSVSFYVLFMCFNSLQFMTAQVDSVFVSDVKYKTEKFNNSHAGSGFLLHYKGKVYGITAKHVLFFAKTDNMKTITFGEELDSWTFRSAHVNNQPVTLGQLVNENPNELIEMPPKGDWLIFEVNAPIPEHAIVYQIRKTPLEVGEKVSFLGFPYNNMKPVNVEGVFNGLTKDGNLSLDVPNGKYGGCSGGPVVDQDGKLVGIVSMGYFNKKLNKHIFEPASLDYFYTVMKNDMQ